MPKGINKSMTAINSALCLDLRWSWLTMIQWYSTQIVTRHPKARQKWIKTRDIMAQVSVPMRSTVEQLLKLQKLRLRAHISVMRLPLCLRDEQVGSKRWAARLFILQSKAIFRRRIHWPIKSICGESLKVVDSKKVCYRLQADSCHPRIQPMLSMITIVSNKTSLQAKAWAEMSANMMIHSWPCSILLKI